MARRQAALMRSLVLQPIWAHDVTLARSGSLGTFGVSLAVDDLGSAHVCAVTRGTEAAAAVEQGRLALGDRVLAINGHVLVPGWRLAELLPASLTQLSLTVRRSDLEPGARSLEPRNNNAISVHVPSAADSLTSCEPQLSSEHDALWQPLTLDVELSRPDGERSFGLAIARDELGGCYVAGIEAGSPAATSAQLLQLGDVVVSVNGQSLTAASDLPTLVNSGGGSTLELKVIRAVQRQGRHGVEHIHASTAQPAANDDSLSSSLTATASSTSHPQQASPPPLRQRPTLRPWLRPPIETTRDDLVLVPADSVWTPRALARLPTQPQVSTRAQQVGGACGAATGEGPQMSF